MPTQQKKKKLKQNDFKNEIKDKNDQKNSS